MRFPYSTFVAPLLFAVMCCAQRTPSSTSATNADRLFRDASAAYSTGRFAEAEAKFRQLVRAAPDVPVAHAALGAVLLQRGNASAAIVELATAHRMAPADADTTLKLALAQQATGQNVEAVTSFREAVAGKAALSAEQVRVFAIALGDSGDLSGAQQMLEQGVQGEAPSPLLLDTLATVQAQRGDFSAAEQRLEQALTLEPGLASAHAHLGSVLLALHQPAPAASELTKAVDLGDRSPLAASQLGRALITLNKPADAVTALEANLKVNATATDVLYTLALAKQAGGDTAGALPLFQRAVATMPNNAEVHTNYGLALVQSGNAAAGLQQYRLALAGGDSALLRQNMGVAYLQGNDVDHALEQFRAGLTLQPDDVQLHYNLGLALKLKDDGAGATAELEHAAALDPQLPDPPYTLGVLKMQQGDFAGAAAQLSRAVALQPANGEAWALLGSVDRQAGNGEKAEDALRHAIAAEPAAPGPHITLAALLAERGDREGAAAERKIAADLSRAAVSAQRGDFALRSGRALLQQGKAAEALVQLQTAVSAMPQSPEAHRALAEALQQTGRSAEAAAERKAATLP